MVAENLDEDFELELSRTKENNINRILEKIKKNGGLTKEQTLLLFNRYHEDISVGVLQHNSISRTILILAYDKFINYIISKLNLSGDDLYTVGKIGLIKAIDSYDTAKDVMFMTYAAQCVKNEILMFLRKENATSLFGSKVCSLDSAVNNKDEEFALYEVIPTDEDFVLEVADSDEFVGILKLFKHLSPIEQYCVIATIGIYEKPLKQAQIAVLTGVSQPYISKIVKSALYKLNILATKGEGEDNHKYQDLLKRSYPPMSHKEFKNFKFSKEYDKISLIKKDIEKNNLVQTSAEIPRRNTASSHKNGLQEKEKENAYVYILKHLRPIEQVCIIYRYGLYGQRLWTCAEIAQKINWKRERLEPIYKGALDKVDLLMKSADNMCEDEKQRYDLLINNNFAVIEKAFLKNFSRRRKIFFGL